MSYIDFFSNMLIPLIILIIIVYGIIKKDNVYSTFLDGVNEGFKNIIVIAPMVFAMCFAVGFLRDSKFLEAISNLLKDIFEFINIPSFIVPLMLARNLSYAAALGFFLDILKTFGPDSYEGISSSILMCTSETLVYVLSLYLAAVGIKKTRYILVGGILISIIGLYISLYITKLII